MDHEQALLRLRQYYRSRYGLPFSVADRQGKYYGTHVVDIHRSDVAEFWTAEGEPSRREKARFGGEWTPEMWRDYVSDSHWECEDDLEAAECFVAVFGEPPR